MRDLERARHVLIAFISIGSLAHCHRARPEMSDGVLSAASVEAPPALQSVPVAEPVRPSRQEVVRGLDLSRMTASDDGNEAPLADGKTAILTLDPRLQREALSLLTKHKLPRAAVVMIDTKTGAVLVYASHVEGSSAHEDVCAEAQAPSASVFKIVTASALVQQSGLTENTQQCYAGGGEQRLTLNDLEEDPLRDKWCPTLATAMGKSTNTVFARLADKHLGPSTLGDTARAMGYGSPVPFDLPNEASGLTLPEDKLGFARTAAGFWNTTLSPLEAAMLSTTIAREGESIRPFLVKRVTDANNSEIFSAEPEALRRVVSKETALSVTAMMEHTITEGTSFRAFHDPRGKGFLPGVSIAGKTGTLNDPDGQHLYSWFTGFAPSRPKKDEAQIAIAVLVVNQPKWNVKANVVAREMLRKWHHPNEADAVASRAHAK